MSSSTDLPPPGPERDRLVAEALGELPYSHGYPPDAPCAYSTSDHAAYDTLEAWKRGGKCRTVTICLQDDGYWVALYEGIESAGLGGTTPTLGDAASRAIIEAKRRPHA